MSILKLLKNILKKHFKTPPKKQKTKNKTKQKNIIIIKTVAQTQFKQVEMK